MLRVSSTGNFKRTRDWVKRMFEPDIFENFDQYGQMGVQALRANTPVETGLTADSWSYRIIRDKKRPGIEWFNTNAVGGGNMPVVILLQYGHGTGTGGYVSGRDFINPSIEPVFEAIAQDFWREVTR